MLFSPLHLDTNRLHIRPLVIDDLETVAAINDAGFGEHPLEYHREWLQWSIANYTALGRMYQPPYGERAITLKATDEMVGLVGIVPSLAPYEKIPSLRHRLNTPNALFTPAIGLFWATHPDHRSQGYASEAAQRIVQFLFDDLNLAYVVAQTDDDNTASIAVMRRIGMSIEHNPDPEPEWLQVVGIRFNPSL